MTNLATTLQPYPLGVFIQDGRIRAAYAPEDTAAVCGILFYEKKTGRQLRKEIFTEQERIGNIYCKYIGNIEPQSVSYLFFEGDRLLPDARARAFSGSRSFGKSCHLKELRAVFPQERFDWGNDRNPRLPMRDCIGYCLHVRGFTIHASSGVTHRGTFEGIAEKLPYLLQLGVTTLELQPAYEFTELALPEELPEGIHPHAAAPQLPKLNYWGYKKGFYYAPKAAYSAGGDAVRSMKELVRSLHAAGMELVLQFYFPEHTNPMEIAEILRFWVLEYHVDGFRLLGVRLPMEMLAADPLLAGTKLWGEEVCEASPYHNLSVYRNDYLYTMRKFLKGDDGMLEAALYQMRQLPQGAGRVHYMTNYDGFTLMDLVSYDQKHNEANGEENRDGNEYNCSWNCGEEGSTRRTRVKQLRIRQIKNAMCLLLLTQSTPLIFMGDEFGNSQKGNNNPYCQDNLISWLDWGQAEKGSELLDFWKMLTAFRKEHPILHPQEPLRLMDHISCGYPDLSYHGESAWKLGNLYHSRCAGLMFCGKYAKTADGREDSFVYAGVNMHWEPHTLALPKLPKGMEWEAVCSTASGALPETANLLCTVAPRSVVICVGKNRKGRE